MDIDDDIVAHGGGILSEAPPGAKIHQGSFPERNRLIAALCHALIVVEAREKSGTLITARMALELNREVLAVPGSIFSPASVGTHSLISAGARIYTGVADLWKALTLDAPTAMRTVRTSIQLSAEDRRIIDCLQNTTDGVPPAKLNELLGLEESTLFSRLGLLELQGLIRQTFTGNWVAV
jgi:DNA processing protein